LANELTVFLTYANVWVRETWIALIQPGMLQGVSPFMVAALVADGAGPALMMTPSWERTN
jgi:hypothetical protein